MQNKKKIIIGLLLFTSLSLNVFFSGLIIGDGFKDKRQYSHKKDIELRKNLNDKDKEILKKTMDLAKQEMRLKKEEYLKAKAKVKDLMQADTIDLDAIENAIILENNKKIELMTFMSQVKIKASKELSREGLKALSNMRRHKMMSGDKRKDKKHNHDKKRDRKEVKEIMQKD